MVNVIVIGLGSMGKRRIRLMKEINLQLCIFDIDSRKDRREEAQGLFGIECFKAVDEVKSREINAVFICTSPLSHNTLIK